MVTCDHISMTGYAEIARRSGMLEAEVIRALKCNVQAAMSPAVDAAIRRAVAVAYTH